MADIKELKKKRSTYKGRITVFKTYLSSLEVSDLKSCQVMELQLRVDRLESLFKEFDETQTEIECLTDMESELEERTVIENQYYSLLASAKDILKQYLEKENEDRSSSSSRCNRQVVKLPTIQLPKFSGSYDNWLEFRDTFMSLVHDNDDIDAINKFHYLRSSLDGSAAIVVQSIEFSSQNYKIAWELLCERFDNKRILIQNHIASLFNLEQINKESSISLKRILDQINKNLRALKSLGEPVEYWDTLLIYIFSHKLDTKTFREWEEYKGNLNKNIPLKIDKFFEFIRNRADLIETLEASRQSSNFSNNVQKPNSKVKALVTLKNDNNADSQLCPKCDGKHKLNLCPQFLTLTNKERLSVLPNYKLCFNCFDSGHFANRCKKTGCKVCKRKHHTLIHVSDYNQKTADPNMNVVKGDIPPPAADSSQVALSAHVIPCAQASGSAHVLLSTALIKLYDNNNTQHTARALLDSGSSSCLMTQKVSDKLNLPFINVNKSIQGINNSLTPVRKMCNIHIKSLDESYSTDLNCFVLPTITDNVPAQSVDLSNINFPSDIRLADPNFHTPAEIDLIIGADVFWNLLETQKISLGVGKPTLCQTKLGWLVCGSIKSGFVLTSTVPIKCNFTNVQNQDSFYDNIQNQLSKFWQLEELNYQSPAYSEEEKQCEEYFINSTTRSEDGRFIVKIPLKESSEVLGDSLQRAKRCFLSLENRNRKQPLFNNMYKEFMKEYFTLGHMSESQIDTINKAYFIPHHGVLRESSTTTKLRVVFNASAPTTSGFSFNNIQMVGPTVQDDLLSILLRFRFYKYVLSADVEKMYRQVSVHPSDRHLQQIIWRDEPSSPLKAYQLNTVTYGTASAPYLATRCLKQIGLDCKDPQVSEVILHDFYVDDLLTGVDQIDAAHKLRDDVTDALASACMPLRKWKSNEPALLPNRFSHSTYDLNIGGTETNKTLGLHWQTHTDTLCFPINVSTDVVNTKREMLSVIAQIFDPLGLLAPCVILMKCLLQRLWLDKLSWDERLPNDVNKIWTNIIKLLPLLNNLKIPRRVVLNSYKSLEIHIFSDASERAYGACLYVRCVYESGSVSVHLLTAKSRVAPIKPTTIPRLELCAALIGARLYEKVISSLRSEITNVIFWTDSMIVLGWLKMLPIKLNTFVRNRVAEILETTGSYLWRHVPTNENPADFISRGVDAEIIQSLDMWWYGPNFLQQQRSSWPCTPGCAEALPETKSDVSFHTVDIKDNKIINFERFSNFLRLQRSIAYMLRFISLCKKQKYKNSYLSNEELQNSLNFIIIQSQKESFPEYQLLLNNKNLPHKSPLLKLNPNLDENKVMRVGGRLSNSEFSFNKKHPIIIQSAHHFTKLLFKFEHVKLMHAGPQLLLSTIRESYWPLGGRNLAKLTYRSCVLCRRLKGKTVVPQMGNLPGDRVTMAAYPFQTVGVDYAGPINCASRQGRGCKLVKVYIVIFICFATKAIHLELVGDMTSSNYLQALRRFISRRGKPLNLYSDNGTSFVGAFNELSKFLRSNCDSISETIANDGITFHFIPAYAPHFGGLWEAGVKSTKYHLGRVLGNCNLSYEELNTTLIQIESILNSRPLTPLSASPEDLTPLTPGHFIIGRPFTSLPVKDLREHSFNHLTRHQRIEQLRQHFWSRWSTEYISELQQRVKWHTSDSSLRLNTLVVIKEDNQPPLRWKLGRIIDLHPGKDGISRVADIRTATGVIRRAFSKICPLLDADVSG